MFLREKKVGKAAYVQLVQSTRTAQGPRSKVVASLGRSDDPKTRLTLQRLAERSASLSGLNLAEDAPFEAEDSPGDNQNAILDQLFVPQTVDPSALKRLLMERALVRSGLAAHAVRLFHHDEDGLGQADPQAVSVVANAVAGATFACPDLICSTDFVAMPPVPALPSALATVLTRGNSEDDQLCVHIGRSGRSPNPHCLLGHSIFAVAVNGRGRLLMCVHWPDFAGLIDMIGKHVETMLYAMPGRRLTLHLDPAVFGAEGTLALKRTILAIHASHVQFITPLHEPSRLMSELPDQIFEQRPEMPPIEEVKDLRYLRLPDHSLVYAEQAARQMRKDALDEFEDLDDGTARRRDMVRKRVDLAGEWDGTTLLMTNSRAQRKSIANTYLTSLRARDFLDHSSRIGQAIFNHGNLPRDGQSLTDKILALGLLGRAALADTLSQPSIDAKTLDSLGGISVLKMKQDQYAIAGEPQACATLEPAFGVTAKDLSMLSKPTSHFSRTTR